jgi:hypothetical protein
MVEQNCVYPVDVLIHRLLIPLRELVIPISADSIKNFDAQAKKRHIHEALYTLEYK